MNRHATVKLSIFSTNTETMNKQEQFGTGTEKQITALTGRAALCITIYCTRR